MQQYSPLIEKILSGLSIMRWNNFPRLRNITHLDHLGFVLHIGVFLIHILEEKEAKKYNVGIFIRKVLFSGFFTFEYSDINSEVKERIREYDNDLYRLLEEKVYTDILTNKQYPPYIQNELPSILNLREEESIFQFAKIWASYYEAYSNSLVYPDAYARTLKNIISKGEKNEYSCFLKYLDFDPQNQTDHERYLLVIHRLASSFRWNRSQRKYPVSVLSHTFIITFLSYMLSGEHSYTTDESTDMMLTAMFHDIPEAITGDIITPTKKSIPGLETIIEKIEHDMVQEHLLSYISEYSFCKTYALKMLHPWNESHGDIVKKADMLSAYYEANLEAGTSQEFSEIAQRIEKKLADIG